MIEIEAYRARIGCFNLKRSKFRKSLNSSEEVYFSDSDSPLHSYVSQEVLQSLIFFILIMTLKSNINTAFLKMAMLLQAGDIESNPGPSYKIEKVVSGTFHQAHPKFGDSAGIQCACNALYAICFSLIKKISLWKAFDLDYILENGDAVFKTFRIQRALSINELPSKIKIENYDIDIEMLHEYLGVLGQCDLFESHKTTSDTGNGLIFTTNGYSFSLIWSKSNIFLFDSHNRDKNGAFVTTGSSVMLCFKYLVDVQNYIKTEYSKQFAGFNDMAYELQYVRVTTNANISDIAVCIKKYRKKIKNKIYNDKISDTTQHFEIKKQKCEQHAKIIGTPEHAKIKKRKNENYDELIGTPEHVEIKKRKRENYHKLIGSPKHAEIKRQKCEKYAELIGTPKHALINKRKREMHASLLGTTQHEEIKMKKLEKYKQQAKKGSHERILKFTEMIKDGPFYICVVCNRCLYHRSVVLFKRKNYSIDKVNFYRIVTSSDGNVYVCHTCNKKLKKSETPAQAVWNKLDISDFPDDLANLNRLEKAIISRRILFKKVTIMPKGQMPKLKGSICNVLIDTAAIANTLPQGADSNGIIMMKLKCKLVYRGHVYFEAVSPESVRSALEYLKQNNPLYQDIHIDIGQIPENLLSLSEPIDIPIESAPENNNLNTKNIPEDTENPLDNDRLGATETMLLSNTPQPEDAVIAPGEGNKPMSILMDEKCEELAHPFLFPTGKFGYRV